AVQPLMFFAGMRKNAELISCPVLCYRAGPAAAYFRSTSGRIKWVLQWEAIIWTTGLKKTLYYLPATEEKIGSLPRTKVAALNPVFAISIGTRWLQRELLAQTSPIMAAVYGSRCRPKDFTRWLSIKIKSAFSWQEAMEGYRCL